MSHLRQARTGSRWASDHERARMLAAERLSETLPPDDAAWLDAHLSRCSECRAIADAYAAHALELRSMPRPAPPRDLWARTAAALDAEERRSGRNRRTPARIPGRQVRRPFGAAPLGALAGAMVVVMIVGVALLADQGLFGPVLHGPSTLATPLVVEPQDVAWLTPQEDGTYALNFARLDRVCPAAATPDCAPIDASARKVITLSSAPRAVLRSPARSQFVVVDAATTSVGGSVYVVPVGPPGEPSPSGTSPTPLAIASATPGASDRFTLETSAVGESPAPETSSPATPAATSSPSVVVRRSPTPPPATTVSPGEAGESPRVSPSEPANTPESSSGPQATPGVSAVAGTESPGPSSTTEPSGSATPSSSEASGEPIAIISDVVVVGETAAYSPDGSWFAFTARPADASHGPDIYVWHAGDVSARPITFDHDSIFSSWLGDLVIGSRPASPDTVFEPSPSPQVSPEASPAGSPSPSGSAGPVASQSPDASGPAIGDAPPSSVTPSPGQNDRDTPAPGASKSGTTSTPTDGDEPTTSPSSMPEPSPSPASSGSGEPSPSGAALVAQPVSFVIDPAAGTETELLGAPGWRPVVDPSGRWVVYWSGSIAYDAATRTWNPADGSLVVAPFATLAGSAAATILPSPTAETSPSPLAEPSGSGSLPSASDGSPTSSEGTAPATTGSGQPAASDASTPSPSHTGSGSGPGSSVSAIVGETSSSAGASAAVGSPGESPVTPGESASPSPSPTPLPPLTGPESLLQTDPMAPTPAPLRDWDVRFDPTGAHVAIWSADQVDLEVGRLSLLTFDESTGRVDQSTSLLVDQPSLVGFSIDAGRLAWATPPGQDGEGSRLQVLAWQGDGSGRLTSESATGEGAVLVVR